MALSYPLDQALSWSDHYVRYGFAVLPALVSREFISAALVAVRQVSGLGDLPLNEWDAQALPATACHIPCQRLRGTVLESIYDQPGMQWLLAEMFGPGAPWNGERSYQLFISPYQPEAQAELSAAGHIDFVHTPVPILGSGFMFQVALKENEPFAGNITLWPGSHTFVQKRLMEDPDRQWPKDIADYSFGEPYEFTARAGDVLIFHHLAFHAGNVNHCASHRPRIVLHGQGLRERWLAEVDPANSGLPTWERSLATNGRYRVLRDERRHIEEYRQARGKQPAGQN